MIYLDLECIIKDYHANQNDESIPWTLKKNTHTVCGYSIAYINSKNNDCISDYHHGFDSLQVLCDTLTKYSKNIINSWDIKEYNDLTTHQQENYDNSDKCYFCNKEFCEDLKDPDHFKLEKDITRDPYTGKNIDASHSICNLRYKPQKDIAILVHNGSNYDFKLLIKHIPLHFKKDINLIPENTEKYMTFSFPIHETIFENDDNNNDYNKKKPKVITHKLRFIVSSRLMTSSLDSSVNNLSNLFACKCNYPKNESIELTQDSEYVYSKCKNCNNTKKQLLKDLKQKFKYTNRLSDNNHAKLYYYY